MTAVRDVIDHAHTLITSLGWNRGVTPRDAHKRGITIWEALRRAADRDNARYAAALRQVGATLTGHRNCQTKQAYNAVASWLDHPGRRQADVLRLLDRSTRELDTPSGGAR